MRIFVISILLLSISLSSFGQEQKVFKCIENVNVCIYEPVHRTPQDLQNLIIDILYDGFPGNSSDIYFRISSEKTLLFWDKDPSKRKKVEHLLKALDDTETYRASYMIQVRAEFYMMRESSLKNIGAELNKLKVGRDIVDGLTGGELARDENGMNIGIKFPVAEIGGVIASERALNKVEEDEIIPRNVLSGQRIDISHQTNFYFAPTQAETITETAGISMQGVAKYDRVNNRVMIQNYNLTFGLLTDDKQNVSIVNTPSQTILLEEGMVYPTVSINSFKKVKNKEKGFLKVRTRTGFDDLKIVVYLSAKAIPYNEYKEQIKKEVVSIGTEKLTDKEFNNLSDSCPSDLEMLNDFILTARRDDKYSPMLFLSLKKSNLCSENLKKRVTVSYKMKRFKSNNVNRTFEQLSYKPFVFDEISDRKLTGKEVLNIKVTLESSTGVRVTKKLKFSPSTNKDISDDFWTE